MSDRDQETQQHDGLFLLHATNNHPYTTAEFNNHHHHHHQKSLKKRSSPSPSSSNQQEDQEHITTPRNKKPNFTMLNLPLTTPIQPSKFSLHRTLSAPPPFSPVITSPAIPRSFSDIASSPTYQQVLQTIAPPPSPPPPSSLSPPCSVKRKSHNSKKIKRLEAMTKEISLWCDEAMRQMEQLDQEEEQEPQEVKEDENVTEVEEAVSVDRAGDCLTIHFECPCGKGYQILLSGKNCYYKLVQY